MSKLKDYINYTSIINHNVVESIDEIGGSTGAAIKTFKYAILNDYGWKLPFIDGQYIEPNIILNYTETEEAQGSPEAHFFALDKGDSYNINWPIFGELDSTFAPNILQEGVIVNHENGHLDITIPKNAGIDYDAALFNLYIVE